VALADILILLLASLTTFGAGFARLGFAGALLTPLFGGSVAYRCGG
jgi:hypothetical protein